MPHNSALTSWRWSPAPIEAYSRQVHPGVLVGPANSSYLNKCPDSWNLAFLSHDYSQVPTHPNAQFTIAVSYTAHTLLGTGVGGMPAVIDVHHHRHADEKVQSILHKGPKAFFEWVVGYPTMTGLPLYKLLGPNWIKAMASRIKLCEPNPADVLLCAMDLQPDNLDQALETIAKVRY